MPDVPNEGGRNYITNLASNWQNKYVITNGASANSFLQQNSTTRISPKSFIAVEAGKQYTVSLKELTDADYYFKVTMSTVAAYGVANSMLNRDEWIYSESYTFTAPEGCNYIMISVGCDAGVTPDDLNTKFNIKLEKGNIATDYSQVPEELGWSMAALVPTQQQRYLWKFEYVYYSDGSVEVTQPVNISIAGADGTNGQTSHIHFAFADDATGGGFSLTTPKAYMGWYADFNESASNDPTKYKWSKWKGDEGAPGKPGADGKTAYFHMAYATSADGKTGFSFTESGQQYQGYYTDFVQANSTDPTKYTWMDRRAGVKVGGKNLLLYTADPWKAPNDYYQFVGVTKTDETLNGSVAYKTRSIWSRLGMNWGKQLIDRPDVKIGDEFTYSVYVRTDQETPIKARLFFRYSGQSNAEDMAGEKLITQEWQRFTKTFTVTQKMLSDSSKLSWVGFEQTTNSEDGKYVYYACNMLEEGNIPSPWEPALEDTQEQIDSKADQTLTQDQLNALAEKNRNMEAEMSAKASLAEIEQWKQAYDSYVAQNDADKTEAEQKLIMLTSRVAEWVKDWEDKKVQWSFLDTNMDFGEEGLRLGKKGSPTSILISNDRIGFYSGGSEVASMSNGTLTIDNGIFAKSLQIGHYREEVYEGDKTINVIRWVD